MLRSEINIYEKELCIKLVIYKNYFSTTSIFGIVDELSRA